ncbi:elongation factor P 5-aminopentanone reductase [Halobacillus sp. H74]|uniref:elongation factor P 5-aminopentanone reductase n=1 Tax=Halobacillus sp. H74 TaxID=3457436 RepID=UPI003FCC7D8E
MNKRVLILGASGEIGRATALKLVARGYAVGLQYNANEPAVSSLRKEIPSHQYSGDFQADLSTNEGIVAFLDTLEMEWDAVIFAGGQMWTGIFQDMNPEDMDALYNVHVKAVWMTTKHVLPYMIHQKAGSIILVSSIFGIEGASLEVAYSSVKGAQNSFVKGLAKEVAPSGIRVNAVAPGLIDTKMNAHLTKDELTALAEEIPMGRAGKAEEVSDAIDFLINGCSSYITGQIIQINGGWA